MEFKESEGWDEIVVPDAERWCPQKEGDQLVGIYVNKKEDVGKNRATVYFIKNEENEWIVFGTDDLNRKFKQVPLGCEVGIVFKGEKPLRAPKKPFKMFQVFKRQISEKENQEPKVERVTEEKKPQMFASEEEMKAWQLIEEIAADITVGPVDNKSILMRANRWAREERLDPKDFDRIKEALDKNPFKNGGN